MQSVYADEKNVVILINEFNDFLHFSIDLCSYQSSEFSDTVIYVNDIISYFDLLQFFKWESEFSRTGFVAFQTVFVESVEQLMVCKKAGFQFPVYKTFV